MCNYVGYSRFYKRRFLHLFKPIFGEFWGHIPQMTSPIILIPKRHFLTRKHVVWAIKCENRFSGSTWARSQEKKDRTGQSKKSQSGNISPIWGEAPTVPIKTKIYMVGSLSD